jgi:hypothetical protein
VLWFLGEMEASKIDKEKSLICCYRKKGFVESIILSERNDEII